MTAVSIKLVARNQAWIISRHGHFSRYERAFITTLGSVVDFASERNYVRSNETRLTTLYSVPETSVDVPRVRASVTETDSSQG
jgi:hypothetical protein